MMRSMAASMAAFSAAVVGCIMLLLLAVAADGDRGGLLLAGDSGFMINSINELLMYQLMYISCVY